MSEFYRPASEEEKDEFKNTLLRAPNQDATDQLIADKAHQILDELREVSQLEETSLEGSIDSETGFTIPEKVEEEKSEIDESQIRAILDQYIPLSLSGGNLNPDNTPNFSDVVYSQIINHESILSHDGTINTIQCTLDRVNQVLPEINRIFTIVSGKHIDDKDNRIIAYKNNLLDYKREILLLKVQLEYKLENKIFLQENLIEESLNQYRSYKAKLKKLSEDSPQANDIENIISIYEQDVKKQFAQSPEKYGLGKSKAFDLDINSIIHQFKEAQSTKGGESFHQTDTADTRHNILTELRQTPGIIGVIPITEGTIGSKSADIIAITLKSKDMSPNEIDGALHALYAQIQTSARSIDTNTLDYDNIDLYDQNGRISLSETQSDSTINLSELFQVHLIKVAKRSTDLKYDTAYQPHTQAMARFSDNWDATNNISALTDSYYESLDGRPTKRKFNKALFQLSVQDILGLPLA